MAREGNHFRVPETVEEWRDLWDESDVITDDSYGSDMDDRGEWRYAFNTSWAYLSAAEQSDGEDNPSFPGSYFAELSYLGEMDQFVTIGDGGDGCVTHVLVKCPEGRTPDKGPGEEYAEDTDAA